MLFVIGAAKSGTTSLVDYLNQHPDIFVPAYKEPCRYVDNFGCNEKEYRSLYSQRNEKILVDASTAYLYAAESARFIASCDNAKILVVLREPVSMAYSFWQYMTAIGSENLSFEQAVSPEVQEYRRSDKFIREASGWYADYLYLDRPRYVKQLRRYLDLFPKEQVKVLLFDDLVNDAQTVCNEVVEWLGIAPYSFDVSKISNEGGAARFAFVNKLRQRRYPILKRILPVEWRAAVRRATRKLNLKSGKKSVINTETKNKLMFEYRAEVAELSKLVDRDLVKLWGYDAL